MLTGPEISWSHSWPLHHCLDQSAFEPSLLILWSGIIVFKSAPSLVILQVLLNISWYWHCLRPAFHFHKIQCYFQLESFPPLTLRSSFYLWPIGHPCLSTRTNVGHLSQMPYPLLMANISKWCLHTFWQRAPHHLALVPKTQNCLDPWAQWRFTSLLTQTLCAPLARSFHFHLLNLKTESCSIASQMWAFGSPQRKRSAWGNKHSRYDQGRSEAACKVGCNDQCHTAEGS